MAAVMPAGRRLPAKSRLLDVLLRGQLIHQVERLEDEPDVTSSHPGEGTLVHLVGAPPFSHNSPPRAGRAGEMEQR